MNALQLKQTTEPQALSSYRATYVELRLAHLRGLVVGEMDVRAYGALVVRAEELAAQLPDWLRVEVERDVDRRFPAEAA